LDLPLGSIRRPILRTAGRFTAAAPSCPSAVFLGSPVSLGPRDDSYRQPPRDVRTPLPQPPVRPALHFGRCGVDDLRREWRPACTPLRVGKVTSTSCSRPFSG